MSYKKIKNEETIVDDNNLTIKYKCEFVIDSSSDLVNLPTDILPGSTAYTADLSRIYVFSPSGTWTEVA